jgi:hypothetical protein
MSRPRVPRRRYFLDELLVAAAVRKAEKGAFDFEGHGRRRNGERFGGVEVRRCNGRREAKNVILLGFAFGLALWFAIDFWFVFLEGAKVG